MGTLTLWDVAVYKLGPPTYIDKPFGFTCDGILGWTLKWDPKPFKAI